MHKSKTSIGLVEFVALMAIMTSLTAMSIDSMLPALSEIGLDLGLQRPNDSQLVISLLLVGMAVGQMFLGPLSDSIGRKPTVYIGFGLFIIGCLMSMLTTNFQIMLAGRMLQGLGAAAPRGSNSRPVYWPGDGPCDVVCDGSVYSGPGGSSSLWPGHSIGGALALDLWFFSDNCTVYRYLVCLAATRNIVTR